MRCTYQYQYYTVKAYEDFYYTVLDVILSKQRIINNYTYTLIYILWFNGNTLLCQIQGPRKCISGECTFTNKGLLVSLASRTSMTLDRNVCVLPLPCEEGSTLEYIWPISQATESAFSLALVVMNLGVVVALLGLVACGSCKPVVHNFTLPLCDSPEAEAAAQVALDFINAQHTHGYKYTLNQIEDIKVINKVKSSWLWWGVPATQLCFDCKE